MESWTLEETHNNNYLLRHYSWLSYNKLRNKSNVLSTVQRLQFNEYLDFALAKIGLNVDNISLQIPSIKWKDSYLWISSRYSQFYRL